MGIQGVIWVSHGSYKSMEADGCSRATMSALFTLYRGGGRGRIVSLRGGEQAERGSSARWWGLRGSSRWASKQREMV